MGGGGGGGGGVVLTQNVCLRMLAVNLILDILYNIYFLLLTEDFL